MLAAGPRFFGAEAGSSCPALSKATSNFTSKLLGIITSGATAWLALPVARPS